jgi:PAS domain S-box-containing protein
MSKTQRTILIIDDSPEDRELYRRYLLKDEVYSCNILEASLGRQGLQLWHQYQPDAVLLDYRLPDLDGLEFLAQLQMPSPQACLPIIMLTGQGNEAIAVQAMKAGAQDYLIKDQITLEGLWLTINGAITKVQLHNQLQQRIERDRIVSQITQQIHQSLDLEQILNTTVNEVRRFIKSDRVLIFRLQSDGWGKIVSESVAPEWTSLLSTSYQDPCLVDSYIEPFRQGLITNKPDIHDGSIAPCHVELLAQLEVRANLVVPIRQGNQLWGMLIVHHCSSSRQWQALEIDLLKELATQVGIGLQQAELYQKAQAELAERKQAEESLRQSEERYRYLAESIPQLIWTANPGGVLLDVNQNWLTYTGISLEQIQIDGWQQIIHPEDLPHLSDRWIEAQQTGSHYQAEGRMRRRDGTYRWHLHQAIPLKDELDQVIKWFGTATDIHDRFEIQIEREQILKQEQAARAKAERANRIKDEFLAVLSHELRTPLTPILGFTQLLRENHLDQNNTKQALEIIERNVRLQTRLIDDLLDIARILRGKLMLKTKPVNLPVVIESAIETVQAAANSKSIQLEQKLSQLSVSGDSVRLQQIIWNLLSNAIKFTPHGGQVAICVERVKDLAQITVTDTGKGINPDFLPHIFEYFRQEDASITRKHSGLGLGLAIVHYLVEAHGGTITADSLGESQGATFTVRLPLLNVNVELEKNQGDKSRESNTILRGIRVLVVDDEPDSRTMLAYVLDSHGAEAMVVASAHEVLSVLESFNPDILVSDIGMPEINGYDLLSQIRALTSERKEPLPAIAVTAYAREEDRQQAYAAGFQGYVSKPVDLGKLMEIIFQLAKVKNTKNQLI